MWCSLLRVWDVNSSILIQGPFTDHKYEVISVEFSLNGKKIISGGWGAFSCVWDVDTGALLSGPTLQHAGGSLAVTFTPASKYNALSPDGKWLAGYTFQDVADRTICWNLGTREVVANFKAHTDLLQSVTFSPDSRFFLFGSPDQIIQVFTINS
jgi:WD40 repeat protein